MSLEGIVISDLYANAINRECVCEKASRHMWRAIPYESNGANGVMLNAASEAAPPPVTFSPALTGWHKIYVCMGNLAADSGPVRIRLSSDKAASILRVSPKTIDEPDPDTVWRWNSAVLLEEGLWRCADMTGQSVTIEKIVNSYFQSVSLMWLRFVPMSEEEVGAYQAEWSNPQNRRLFTSCDMYSCLADHAPRTEEEWLAMLETLRYSDVGHISIEVSPPFPPVKTSDDAAETGGNHDTVDLNFHYAEIHKLMAVKAEKHEQLLTAMAAYAHDMGILPYFGYRMGIVKWAYPYDTNNNQEGFAERYPALRCVDRDGTVQQAASYAYPETRRYVIDAIARCVPYGGEGVALYFTRGVPFVLFEEPVVAHCMETYGVDPRTLPLGDERVNGSLCHFLTLFMRELRRRLDEETTRLGRSRLKIQAHVGGSFRYNKMFAADAEAWSREGLVDSLMVGDVQLIERLDGVMSDEEPGRIDLLRYRRRSREGLDGVIRRRIYTQSHVDQEYIDEYAQLTRQYGVAVYHHLMPVSAPPETFRKLALEMYEMGIENIFLWDLEHFAFNMADWSMVRRLGHRDELAQIPPVKGREYNVYRMVTVGGADLSNYNPNWVG